MKAIIYGVLLLVLSSCSGGDGGGEDANACSDLGLKISNGDSCRLSGSPVVLLAGESASRGVYICTGTLVTSDDILTAAHCLPNDIEDLGVLADGRTFFASEGGITSAAVHPSFTEFVDGSQIFDVAMLTISTPVGASPVPLGVSDLVQPGEKITAYGFGSDEEGRDVLSRDPDDILRAGFMRVSAADVLLFEAQYDLTGSSVCRGDSGGPAIQSVGGVSSIVGVTSFGSVSNCSEGSFAVFGSIQDPEVYGFIRDYAPDVQLR